MNTPIAKEIEAPGDYRVKLVSLENAPAHPEGKFGPRRHWTFEHLDTDHEGLKSRGSTPKEFGPDTRAFEWVEALLGRFLYDQEPVRFDELIGRECIAHMYIIGPVSEGRLRIKTLKPLVESPTEANLAASTT